VIERLGSFLLRYLRKACFFSARCLRAVWRFNSLNSLFELMSLYSSLLNSLFVPVFLIKSFYLFFAFTSAFAAISVTLKEVIFLASWSDIAKLFYVLKEFNSSRFEGRFILDLRFLF
jgi:hypothetical protein